MKAIVHQGQLAKAIVSLVAVGLILIGVAALVFPVQASQMYGLPITEQLGLAFVRATGFRDLAIGLGLFFMWQKDISPRLWRLVIAAITLIPIGDAIIVGSNGGLGTFSFFIHASSVVVLGVLICMLGRD